MKKTKLSVAEAKQIKLADYLTILGHHPDPIKSNERDYWYLSPLPGRNEKSASFKVNIEKNVWFDHGIGRGGNIIDFCILYHNCPIPELLEMLQTSFSFHPPVLSALSAPLRTKQDVAGEKKIKVISQLPITSPALRHYLRQRCIPLSIAKKWCLEVNYELSGNQFFAIGFKNRAGGFELRNPGFKGSSSPKDVTFVDNNNEHVAVFEGFFSFLAYMTIHQNEPTLPNFLILNSLSFFEKSRDVMEAHQAILLFLDRDAPGVKCANEAAKWSNRYIDRSNFYKGQKDINAWLIQNEFSKRQDFSKGRHL